MCNWLGAEDRVHRDFGAQRYRPTVLRPHLSPSPDKSSRMGPQWLEVRKEWGTSPDVRLMTYFGPINPPRVSALRFHISIFFGWKKLFRNLFGLGITHTVGDLIEAQLIMTCCVPLILIQTCFETMKTFQMTAQDSIRIESRIFIICAVRSSSNVASLDKAKSWWLTE